MGVFSFLFPSRKKAPATDENKTGPNQSPKGNEEFGLTPITPADQLLAYANKRSHDKEDWIQKIIYTLDLSEDEVKQYVMPVINRLAAYMQHAPASQSQHHAFYGGLFWHSLEVGYLCARAAGKVVQIAETPRERLEKEKRWRVAAFLTGAFHDIGKVYTNAVVISDRGKTWNALVDGSIPEWLERHGATSYDFVWSKARNSIHESYAMPLMLKIIDETNSQVIAWLSEYDKALIEEVQLSLAKASTELPMARFMIKADSQSVANNLKGRSGFTEQSAVGTEYQPVISHTLQHLVIDATINAPGAEVYLSRKGDIYIALKAAWEKIVRIMSAYEEGRNRKNRPASPDAFAELMAAIQLGEPADPRGSPWWHINPDLSQIKNSLSIPVVKIKHDHPLRSTLASAAQESADPIAIEEIRTTVSDGIGAQTENEQNRRKEDAISGSAKGETEPGQNRSDASDTVSEDPLESARKNIPQTLTALGEMDVMPETQQAASAPQPFSSDGDQAESEPAEADPLPQAPEAEKAPENATETTNIPVANEQKPKEAEPVSSDAKAEVREQASQLLDQPEPVEVEGSEQIAPDFTKLDKSGKETRTWEKSLLELDDPEPLENILGKDGTEALKQVREIIGDNAASARFILRLLARLFTGQDELGKHMVHVKGSIGLIYPDAFSVINALKREERVQVLDDFEKEGLLLKEDDLSGRISTAKGFRYVKLNKALSEAILEFLIRTNAAWDPADEYWRDLISTPALKVRYAEKEAGENAPPPVVPETKIQGPLRIIQPSKTDIPLPKDIEKPSQALKQLYFQANARGGGYLREPFEEYEDYFKTPKSVLDVIAEIHGFDRNDLLSVMTLHKNSKVRLADDGVIIEKMNKNKTGRQQKESQTEDLS